MSAIDLNARASATFDAKLAETEVLLRQAARTHAGKITQANSLGATVAADKICVSVRRAALEKSAKGLPMLSPFAKQLTKKTK